jgi:hypothetical protein
MYEFATGEQEVDLTRQIKAMIKINSKEIYESLGMKID